MPYKGFKKRRILYIILILCWQGYNCHIKISITYFNYIILFNKYIYQSRLYLVLRHRCLAFLFVFFFVPERCTVLLSLLAVSLLGVAGLSMLTLPLGAAPVVELLLPLVV